MVGYGNDSKDDDLDITSQWVGSDQVTLSEAYADIGRNKTAPGPRFDRPPTIEKGHESTSDHAIYRTYVLPMGLVWISCPILPVVGSRVLLGPQSMRLLTPYNSSSTRPSQLSGG